MVRMSGFLCRMKNKIARSGGMTLIELIVGLAISSVVSVMAAQFFSIAVRLHRSSTEISNIQKEAQAITTNLERAIMGAEELYFFDNGAELYLLLGRQTTSRMGDGFSGEIFYFNRADRKLYIDMDFTVQVAKQNLFNTLRSQSEIGRIAVPEYMVSNKVEELELTLSKDLRQMQSLGNHTYATDGTLTVTANLTMQYHESRSYHYELRTMPREQIRQITWNE